MFAELHLMALPRWHSTDRRSPQAPLPATCGATTSGHDGRNPSPVLLRVGRTVVRHMVCDGCREVYASMGLPLVPDRRGN
jgi:hypothetical protein